MILRYLCFLSDIIANNYLREAFKKEKYYLDREIVAIPSDPPTIETVSEYLDSEYW